MRRPNWNSSWWLWAVIYGPVFAVLTTALYVVSGKYSVPGAVATGVLEGLFFGVVMGVLSSRAARRMSAHVGDVPVRDQRAVGRAAFRGPVPEDPELRVAAMRVAAFRSQQAHRTIVVGVGGSLAFCALSVYLAISDGPGWWLSTAFWAALALVGVLQPRRLDRRVALLGGHPRPT